MILSKEPLRLAVAGVSFDLYRLQAALSLRSNLIGCL